MSLLPTYTVHVDMADGSPGIPFLGLISLLRRRKKVKRGRKAVWPDLHLDYVVRHLLKCHYLVILAEREYGSLVNFPLQRARIEGDQMAEEQKAG